MNGGYPKTELNDGTILNLELKLNIKKLLMINRGFDTGGFVKMAVGEGSMGISIIQDAKAAYITYRQTGMTDCISFDEFIDKQDSDVATASYIYQLMMFKQTRDVYQKKFEKASKERKLQK